MHQQLAIFAADEGIAGNSAARTIFTHFIRRRNRGSLAIFSAEEIASELGASKKRAIFWGAVKIAAAAAENRAILVHSGPDSLILFFLSDTSAGCCWDSADQLQESKAAPARKV